MFTLLEIDRLRSKSSVAQQQKLPAHAKLHIPFITIIHSQLQGTPTEFLHNAFLKFSLKKVDVKQYT